MLWSNVIDMLRGGLFVLAHWCGGSLGAAILLASATVRVALLPVTLKATRRRLVREQEIRALAPQVERLKKRYAAQPERILAATRELYESNGIKTFDQSDMLASLVGYPPAAALYATIRRSAGQTTTGGFLWVQSLAKPDRLLTILACVISGLIARATMTLPQGTAAAQLLPVVLTAAVTFIVLSHLGAGLALYSIANSIILGVERMIAVRTLKPAAT